jgi:hypothetical protein
MPWVLQKYRFYGRSKSRPRKKFGIPSKNGEPWHVIDLWPWPVDGFLRTDSGSPKKVFSRMGPL